MTLPDYEGGSIVNLMASIGESFGNPPGIYPALSSIAISPFLDDRHVILLIIDGMGYDFLVKQSKNSILSEHLVATMTSVFPSTTASAVTAFLTGVAPQQHALTGWFVHFAEIDTVAAPLPFCTRDGGTPLQADGVRSCDLFHQPGFAEALQAPSYVVLPEYIAGSAYSQAHSGPARRVGYRGLDSLFSTVSGLLRESDERTYVHAYWPDLDGLAHPHGIASREVAEHFTELDRAFGQFLHALQGTQTTVIVTADHGFVDTTPKTRIDLSDHPVLSETLTQPLCGEPRAAYCYVHPERRDTFERYVGDHLSSYASLYSSRQIIADGFFGLGSPHSSLAHRAGNYTLIMKENYAIGDRLPGEKKPRHIGVHGGTSEAEMRVPLVIARA